ncbi:hypothetical protein, partial [Prescottella equi]|uniref:hypothetical protein n=1 Tax=Rhodococcus hoagii TaxID=43767 RepID=UPI0016426E93
MGKLGMEVWLVEELEGKVEEAKGVGGGERGVEWGGVKEGGKEVGEGVEEGGGELWEEVGVRGGERAERGRGGGEVVRRVGVEGEVEGG